MSHKLTVSDICKVFAPLTIQKHRKIHKMRISIKKLKHMRQIMSQYDLKTFTSKTCANSVLSSFLWLMVFLHQNSWFGKSLIFHKCTNKVHLSLRHRVRPCSLACHPAPAGLEWAVLPTNQSIRLFPSLITYSPLFYERLTERSDFLLWVKKWM